MNRKQLNLALGAAVLALAAAVLFSQKKEEKGQPLTSLTSDAVDRISIEHPGEPAIRLEKKDGNWLLTAPVTAEADQIEITALTGLAEQESKQALDTAGVNRKELDLDPPKYEIVLNHQRLSFGGVEPLAYRRYVQTTAGIYLVENPPSPALDKDYADLVAKNLLPEKDELVRIELPGLVLSKGEDGKWSAKPASDKATAEGIQKVVDGWKAARSMWNERVTDAKSVKGAKGDRVTLATKDRTFKWVIAERNPQFKLYAPDLGIRYVLSKALTEELLKLPDLPKKEEKEKPAAEAE